MSLPRGYLDWLVCSVANIVGPLVTQLRLIRGKNRFKEERDDA